MEQEEQRTIDAGVDSIAADLGLGASEHADDTDTADAQDTTAAPETVAADTGKTEDEAAAAAAATAAVTVRAAPKAWAKEQHERWSKLDKDTQDYIEHREKQMLDGLSQYSDKAKRADVWETAVRDYMPLIQAQGIQPPEAVRYLFEAHRQLSSGTPEQRAAYLVRVAQSYGIDMAKAAAGGATDEPPAVKELRERTERLERERQDELRQRHEETTQRVASEVSSFAEAKDEKGNPKHPYFDECAVHIAALINAGHTLEKAYEEAVYANPVTRAKELARLKTEEEAALRAKAKQEAEKARNASRSNVNSRDTRRAPTASTAKKWEDTLDQTFKEIQERTH
jgi:hypothetical protein